MSEDARSELLGLVAGRRARAADASRVSALFGSSSSSEGEEEGELGAPNADSPGGESGSDDDGYDADLMGDDADRARLAALPEVEREAVLYERAQARAARAERRALAEKMARLDGGRAPRAPSAAAVRKRQTLDELRAARAERAKTGRVSRRRRSDSDSEYAEDATPPASDAESDQSDASGASLDLALAERMRISRDDVVRLAAHPEFDAAATGCLVRLSVGAHPATGAPLYRVAEVRRVVPYHRPYRVPHSSGDGAATNKAAVLRHGRAEKTFRLDVVSNAPFTPAEYARWTETMAEEGVPLVSRRSAEARAAAWRELVERPLSDAAVAAMVAAKRELGVAPGESAAERRVRLLRERDAAAADGRAEDAARLSAELSGGAASTQPAKRRTLLAPSSATLAGGAATDTRLDPFSRRKCQPAAHHFADDAPAASGAGAPAAEAAKPAPVAAPAPQRRSAPLSAADAHRAIDLDLDD